MKWNLLLLAVTLAFTACKKDDESIDCNPPEKNYTPMKTGSYWVYEWYRNDTNGVETFEGTIDSVYIAGDTLINGMEYSIKTGNWFGSPRNEYLRKENGELINHRGDIIFSSTNFTDTLWVAYDPGAKTRFFYSMTDPGLSFSTPAGTFDVLDYRGSVVTELNVSWSPPRFIHHYWADGIGIVGEEHFYFSAPAGDDLVRKLVRYHIAK